MKVTVCQLHEAPEGLNADWQGLVEHVREHQSDLVLLPEMPFHRWLAGRREVDREAWVEAVEQHDRWLARLEELAPAAVLATRPTFDGGRPRNQGFVWQGATGCLPAHDKEYLPDEELFWEASWYERGDGTFETVDLEIGDQEIGARCGFMICTELWFLQHARAYGRAGAHVVAVPRATPGSTAEKWLAGGRAAAVISGAYCLSSNRGGLDRRGIVWGGAGWIIEPEEGEVLAVTSEDEPFVTREIDLGRAEKAKASYPRYVTD